MLLLLHYLGLYLLVTFSLPIFYSERERESGAVQLEGGRARVSGVTRRSVNQRNKTLLSDSFTAV